MSAREKLSNLPWDLIARMVQASIGAIRRARDIKHAEDIVEAMERVATVPGINIDEVVDRVVSRVDAELPPPDPEEPVALMDPWAEPDDEED